MPEQNQPPETSQESSPQASAQQPPENTEGSKPSFGALSAVLSQAASQPPWNAGAKGKASNISYTQEIKPPQEVPPAADADKPKEAPPPEPEPEPELEPEDPNAEKYGPPGTREMDRPGISPNISLTLESEELAEKEEAEKESPLMDWGGTDLDDEVANMSYDPSVADQQDITLTLERAQIEIELHNVPEPIKAMKPWEEPFEDQSSPGHALDELERETEARQGESRSAQGQQDDSTGSGGQRTLNQILGKKTQADEKQQFHPEITPHLPMRAVSTPPPAKSKEGPQLSPHWTVKPGDQETHVKLPTENMGFNEKLARLEEGEEGNAAAAANSAEPGRLPSLRSLASLVPPRTPVNDKPKTDNATGKRTGETTGANSVPPTGPAKPMLPMTASGQFIPHGSKEFETTKIDAFHMEGAQPNAVAQPEAEVGKNLGKAINGQPAKPGPPESKFVDPGMLPFPIPGRNPPAPPESAQPPAAALPPATPAPAAAPPPPPVPPANAPSSPPPQPASPQPEFGFGHLPPSGFAQTATPTEQQAAWGAPPGFGQPADASQVPGFGARNAPPAQPAFGAPQEIPAGFGIPSKPQVSHGMTGTGDHPSAQPSISLKVGDAASPRDWADNTVSGPASAEPRDQRSSGPRPASSAGADENMSAPPEGEDEEGFDPVVDRASRYAHLLQGSSVQLPTQKGAKKRSSLSLISIGAIVTLVLAIGFGALYGTGMLSHRFGGSGNGNHEQAGDEALKHGNLTAAFEEYDNAVSESPNNPDLLHKRGTVEMQLQQYRHAADDFDSAHKLDEQDRGLLLDHAAALIWLKEYDKAILDYNQILTKESNNTKAYFGRALAYMKMHQSQKALADLQKATTLDPKYADAFRDMTSIYYQLGQYKDALRTADIAMKLQPRSGVSYFNKATALRKLGRRPEAEKAYSTALRLMPGTAEFFNDRGFTYLEMGAKPQALRDFRTAVELNPDFEIAQKNLKAVSSQLLAGAHSTDPRAQANAALGYLGLQDTVQALNVGRLAATAASHDAYVLEIAGECELANKNYKEAADAEGAAAGYDPKLADAHFFRARAYLRSRQFKEAAGEYSLYIAAADKSTDPGFADQIAFAVLERALAFDAIGQSINGAQDAQRYISMCGWNYPASGTAALLGWLGYKEADQKAQATTMLDSAAIHLPIAMWPSPVVSFLRQISSESDMLSAAAKNNTQLTDAHTWLGFDHQFEGLTSKSKENFDWVQKNGNPESYSYILSSSRFSQ
jgi:tetratricopeptide (TPR) repeat protein